jgi:dienelactone hydrolase
MKRASKIIVLALAMRLAFALGACTASPGPTDGAPPGASPSPGNSPPSSGGGAPGAPPGPTPTPTPTPAPGNPADVTTKFPGSKLYLPANAKESTPAVVILHGSEGGTDGAIWQIAENLSKDPGFVTLALCWFGCPGTPDRIFHVPLDRVEEAAKWLKTLPMVNNAKVGVFGWSRGAEASVLITSLLANTDVFATAAVHAPSDTIVAAYDPKTQQTESEVNPATGKTVWAAAWTWRGALLFGEPDENTAGPRIQVERYPGALWLSHGTADELWPVQRSYNIAMARDQAGLTTEKHYWQGEGHILMQRANLTAFDTTLAAYLKAKLQ